MFPTTTKNCLVLIQNPLGLGFELHLPLHSISSLYENAHNEPINDRGFESKVKQKN